MPGVRAGRNAKDALGRSGTAVLIDTGQEGSAKIRLIVDTGRMVLLSRDQTVRFDGKVLRARPTTRRWSRSAGPTPSVPSRPCPSIPLQPPALDRTLRAGMGVAGGGV